MKIKGKKHPSYFKYLLLIVLWVIVLISIITVAKLLSINERVLYWGVLGLFIFTIWLLKLTSKPVLLFSFVLIIIAGLFATFKINNLSETIMRISLIGWLIGFTQSFFEYIFKKSV